MRLRFLIIVTGIVLMLIPVTNAGADIVYCEMGSNSKQVYQEYTEEEVMILAAAMQLENGGNSDECLLLTGSVILNRQRYCKWAPNTIYGVITQDGQYAKHTVNNLKTVEVTERVYDLALRLLEQGPVGPPNMIYQAMFRQGKVYKVVDGEYFGLE